MTVRTFPVKKQTMVQFMAFTLPENPNALDIVTYLGSQAPYVADSGLSGYTMLTVNSTPPLALPGLPDKLAGFFARTITLEAHTEEDVWKILGPMNETTSERWPGQVTWLALIDNYDSFMDWYEVNFDDGASGGGVYLISRFFSRSIIEDDPDVFASALKPILVDDGWLAWYFVAGEGVKNAKPRGGSNAVHPAWRTATTLSCKSLSSLLPSVHRLIRYNSLLLGLCSLRQEDRAGRDGESQPPIRQDPRADARRRRLLKRGKPCSSPKCSN